jgi:NAD(P)H-hydrate epimerase
MNTRCELWDAATSAAVDRHSMDVVGMPSAVLMERAALACSREVVALRRGSSLPVIVVCGPGNNGGDGHAIARQLHGWGVPVHVVLATSRRNAAAEAQRALALACGVGELAIDDAPSAAIVVDALLGIGTRGAPQGEVATMLAALRRIAGPRVAVDVPSGVDPDRGAVHEGAIAAAVTVTFGRSKPGLHVTPGCANAGRVVIADIGLVAPPELRTPWSLVDPTAMRDVLAVSSTARHKGDRGHVAIRGGSVDTPGAAVLVATAAFRAGAGLVTVASDDGLVRAAVLERVPEAMFVATSRLSEIAASALVVGPGLTDSAARAGLAATWHEDPRPAIWDASALAVIDRDCSTARRVITPHPGEAARMLARLEDDPTWTPARVQADRIDAATRLAQRTGAVALLKGEGTILAHAGQVAIATLGTSALATAGSGDVLAGIIGAVLARGVEPWLAACAGATLHAAAGIVAQRRHAATMAGDLALALDEAYALLDTDTLAYALPQWRAS